jgi:hypothetical protein
MFINNVFVFERYNCIVFFSIALREVCSFCGSLKIVSVAEEVTSLLCSYNILHWCSVCIVVIGVFFLRRLRLMTIKALCNCWWLAFGF